MHPIAAPAKVEPDQRTVRLELEPRRGDHRSRNGARVYLADQCSEGQYHPSDYSALQLLGKTFSVTMDLSGASCSCNVAWYLVPMSSNTEPGNCGGDFYCDANKVCGVNCDEADLVEANRHAFHSAAHTAFDGSGYSNGWGGGNRNRAFGSAQYGPGGAVIDTNAPFRVHAFFATDRNNELSNVELTLQQSPGRGTLRYSLTPDWYVRRMSASFAEGMTCAATYPSRYALADLTVPFSIAKQPRHELLVCRRHGVA